MKLSVSHESTRKNPITGAVETQELVISAKANSKQEAEELNYDDFEIRLYVNGKCLGEFSRLFSKADLLDKLVEDTDWAELFADLKAEPNY